ncbi:MAG: TraR/DksA family transcriptional regulator [Candidatus Rokubacteria bacterium]|nr:TraR/DksA family transcriptional regulator [Candidatus Rokubacteria bacterium]
MEEIKDRLQRELSQTMQRLRNSDTTAVLEDMGGVIGDNTPMADEVDAVRLAEDREMTFATRSLLLEKANRLAEALERLRDGEYGICGECGEPIAPARLRVMPEVTTCVRCQDLLERTGRRLQPVGAAHEDDADDE